MLDVRHEPMADFFDKWHILGMPFPAVVHRFRHPDFGDFHSHPWGFRSVVLQGGYCEEVLDIRTGAVRLAHHWPGDSFYIAASHIHRITDLPKGECWTLITPQEAKVQEPGFYRWIDGKPWHRLWHESEFTPYEERP